MFVYMNYRLCCFPHLSVPFSSASSFKNDRGLEARVREAGSLGQEQSRRLELTSTDCKAGTSVCFPHHSVLKLKWSTHGVPLVMNAEAIHMYTLLQT